MHKDDSREEMRSRIIGLGESSHRKSYYPELQQKIGELEQARQLLAQSEANLRTIFDNLMEAIFIHDPQTGQILDLNSVACRMFKISKEDALKSDVASLSFGSPPYSAVEAIEKIRNAIKQPQHFEWLARDTSGHVFWVETYLSRAVISEKTCVIATARDITESKEAEAHKKDLELALQQSQKMESIGRLAGGVAHDFNNMLSVILGHAEIALEETPPSEPLHEYLTAIRDAAERSAELTRQLLAFARRQVATPRVIELNATIEGMLKMLRRLIGEDIELTWIPGNDVAKINMDPSQIDQILANLCVNARDAITDIGKITIETQKAVIDEDYSETHPEFSPGEYALLIFSDNGCGMTKEVMANIFEPFFTTKDLGRGTGLGLATVYGVVRQNNGLINVYSEPDHGTTFRIYIPKSESKEKTESHKRKVTQHKGKGETILLVEDETLVLNLGKAALEKLGYNVLTASTPKQALQLTDEDPGDIVVLMTDVIMPEMNGWDLAAQIKLRRPDIKCLFSSGYTANVIAQLGILDNGIHFIQKPYSLQELSTKIQETLFS